MLLRADIYVLISLSCQSKHEIKSPPKTPTPNRNQKKVIVVYPDVDHNTCIAYPSKYKASAPLHVSLNKDGCIYARRALSRCCSLSSSSAVGSLAC